MDFKSMLQHLSQLSEGTQETEKGKIHKADPGGYGRKFDTDEEGDENKDDKKEPAAKRGRGRPKKGADSETGQVAKYDNAKNLQSFMVGNIPKKGLPGKPGKKHSIKEWIEEVEAKYVAEGQQLDELSPELLDRARDAALDKEFAAIDSDLPADQKSALRDYYATRAAKFGHGHTKAVDRDKQKAELAKINPSQAAMRKMKMQQQGVQETAPGQQLTVKPMPGAAQLVDPASNKVMATGDAAAVKNIQGAVAQGKVQMRGAQEGMAESEDDYSAKKARAGKDIGKPGKQFGKIAASAGKKYGSKAAGERVAGAVLSKLRQKTNEADTPSDQNDVGAGLGAGRNQTTLEGKKDFAAKFQKNIDKSNKDKKETEEKVKAHQKDDKKKVEEAAKPDFPDIDDDGNTKEPISKAAKDAGKKPKKKVSESVHKHSSARLLGKSHALAKEGYNCKFDDMEEARMYHEGFKEGLDECYGQMPVQGLVSENPMPATTPGMASAAMSPAMDEGNDFTEKLARTPHGGQFKVGGNTYTDTSDYDSDIEEALMAFESWDKELNALLNEGMSVSISQGQQGMPDSVSVTAQDGEAEQLLNIIKQAGLGLFGGEEKPEGFAPEVTGMSVGGEEEGRDAEDIGVVDDHDGMMALIKKVLGGEQQPEEVGSNSDEGHDYEGEEHDHSGHEAHDHEDSEESCNECGMLESNCECDKEEMDEDESYPQEEYEVAEDNAPDSDAAETTADENAEAAEDSALAKADELNEWANDAGKKGTDESFESDIAFMTKVIAGGLNKEKATGQTTIPVIAGQNDRMGYSATNESIADWRKLAGLK